MPSNSLAGGLVSAERGLVDRRSGFLRVLRLLG